MRLWVRMGSGHERVIHRALGMDGALGMYELASRALSTEGLYIAPYASMVPWVV